MTHTSTEQERAEFEDGAWYWVEKEWWHDEPPKIAPAMYRADSDAWYSWEFAGISTEYLKVLEPCVRHEQAARRAPAKPQWPQFEQCQDAFDAAKNRYPQGNPLGGDHEWHWFQAGWNGRAPVVPHTKVKADFRWDSENQHHIPTLLIEFEPVPAGEPCDAKGWADRDNLAAMLAAAHQPTEVASCR